MCEEALLAMTATTARLREKTVASTLQAEQQVPSDFAFALVRDLLVAPSSTCRKEASPNGISASE